MKKKFMALDFFHLHCWVMNLGFKPFFNEQTGNRFDLGRYRCRGRGYWLAGRSQPVGKDMWSSEIVLFFDPAPTDYPCVKTMIKASNHFTMIKAREMAEYDKVLSLCS